MRASVTSVVLTALAFATPLAAQNASEDESSDSIVVEGTREEVRDQIKAILEPSGGQLSRFDRGFCPRIIGFDAEWTSILDDLIRANAESLGVRPQEKGCTPTAIMIFIDEPQELVLGLRKKMPALFETLYLPEIRRISEKERATYSWRATGATGRDGRQPTGTASINGQNSDAPVIRAFSSSRLYSPTAYQIFNSYLIVDIDKTPGMTLQQIADFATMNLLLDLDEEAIAKAPAGSILKLFEGDDPTNVAPGLSNFDQGLLAGLYAEEDLARRASSQAGRIAATMTKDEDAE